MKILGTFALAFIAFFSALILTATPARANSVLDFFKRLVGISTSDSKPSAYICQHATPPFYEGQVICGTDVLRTVNGVRNVNTCAVMRCNTWVRATADEVDRADKANKILTPTDAARRDEVPRDKKD